MEKVVEMFVGEAEEQALTIPASFLEAIWKNPPTVWTTFDWNVTI